MRICIILAAAVLAAGCGANASRTAAMTEYGEVDSAVARSGDGERVICTRETVVGTRLPNRKTCRTREEWDRISEQSREEVERVQRGALPNAAQDGN